MICRMPLQGSPFCMVNRTVAVTRSGGYAGAYFIREMKFFAARYRNCLRILRFHAILSKLTINTPADSKGGARQRQVPEGTQDADGRKTKWR